MDNSSFDYDPILRGLSKTKLTPDRFADRWIDFICHALPRFDAESLYDFTNEMASKIGSSQITPRHVALIRDVYTILSAKEDGTTSFAGDHIVGLALDESCDLYPEKQINWVFERLPSEHVARELLEYQVGSLSGHLAHFLAFLDAKKVIQIHNWNPKTTWPLGELREFQREDNVPAIRKPKLTQRINPELARYFPHLQNAIDEISQDPAYPTVEPIIRKLASQIVRTGSFGRHIALLGPPGVGKTQSARLIHRILEAMEITGSQYEVFSPGKDTEHHVDEMASSLRGLLDELKQTGGVLLMDEAGKMREREGNANDPANFRKRAMDVVMEQVHELENAGVIVIFAGYQDEFQEVLKQDDGWHRRVLQIPIDPPNVDLLADYVREHFNRQDIAVPGNFQEQVKWLFSEMVSDDSISFGYWATANNFIQALEASAQGDILFGGVLEVEEITKEDFIEAARDIGYINVAIRDLTFTAPIGVLDLESEIAVVDSADGFKRHFGDGR